MQKVAVIFGGKSCEREISILTGVFVMNVLRNGLYVPVPIYVHTDGQMYTSPTMLDVNVFKQDKVRTFTRIIFNGNTMYALNTKKDKIKSLEKIDAAINCCHGGLGEGGGISAMMEWNGIPFASPDLTSSGVFMDKSMTKLVMRALNVPTLDFMRVNQADYEKRGAFLIKNIGRRLKYPVIVKPAHLGSSIGIALAENETELKSAVEAAFELDDRIVIEKYLKQKQDVNCAAYSLDGEIIVSEPEIAFSDGIYTFQDKYVNDREEMTKTSRIGRGRYELKMELREKIRTYTRTIYKRMNLQGVVRMDFLISDEKAYLCEVNTVPGSLAYYLFCERILDARTFFEDLITESMRTAKKKEKKIVETGILNETFAKKK